MDPIVIEVRDMGRPPGMNEMNTMHWAKLARIKKRWLMRIMSAVGTRPSEIPTPCEGQLTVYSANKLDNANAASCEKAPVDALVNLGALEDDSPDHITWRPVIQERCARKDAGIRLEFFPHEEP